MNKIRKGFTLIELTIALAFISVLLILVVVVTINIIGIYTKGQTLRNVNETGRSIIDDMRRTLGDAVPFNAQDNNHLIFYPKTATTMAEMTGGRFCTGSYTYAWNTPLAYNSTPPNRYTGSNQPRLSVVKITDPGGAFCADPNGNITIPAPGDITTVLVSYDTLYIYQFAAFSTMDAASGQTLYSISFVLGTKQGIADSYTTTNNASCTPPAGINSDFNYCAVNRFDFTTRAVK